MRTTSDPKINTVTVRLNDEDIAKLGENKSETIRKLINNEKVLQNNTVLQKDIERLTAENEKLQEKADYFAEQYDLLKTEVATLEQQLNNNFMDDDTGFINVPDTSNSLLADIEVMCSSWGISVMDFLKLVQSAMEETELNHTTGKLMMLTPDMWDMLHNEEAIGMFGNLDDVCEKMKKNKSDAYVSMLKNGIGKAYNAIRESG